MGTGRALRLGKEKEATEISSDDWETSYSRFRLSD